MYTYSCGGDIRNLINKMYTCICKTNTKKDNKINVVLKAIVCFT